MERKVKNNLIVLKHEIERLTGLLDEELREIENKLLAKQKKPEGCEETDRRLVRDGGSV